MAHKTLLGLGPQYSWARDKTGQTSRNMPDLWGSLNPGQSSIHKFIMPPQGDAKQLVTSTAVKYRHTYSLFVCVVVLSLADAQQQ